MMVITSDAGIYFILGPVCCICDELSGKCSHLNRRPCNPFAPSLACPPPQTASIDPRFEIEIGSHYCRAYMYTPVTISPPSITPIYINQVP